MKLDQRHFSYWKMMFGAELLKKSPHLIGLGMYNMKRFKTAWKKPRVPIFAVIVSFLFTDLFTHQLIRHHRGRPYTYRAMNRA